MNLSRGLKPGAIAAGVAVVVWYLVQLLAKGNGGLWAMGVGMLAGMLAGVNYAVRRERRENPDEHDDTT